MMRFPLRASDGQKQILIKTKTEFLNQYDHLWTKDLVKALLSQDAACLSYASSGYTPEMGSQTDFVIGSKGEIWFGSQGETDSLKVITLNN